MTSEAVHQVGEMAGGLVQPTLGPRCFHIGKIPCALQVGLVVKSWQFLVQLGIFLVKPFQERLDGACKKPQTAQMGHVGSDLGGIQPLFFRAESRRLDDRIRDAGK